VTGVGATTSSDGIASFSLWGPSTDPAGNNEIKPEVSAPGNSIRSSYNSSDTSYSTMSGTSMAAPHVSGALALIWSACPSLVGDFEASEQLLKDTALKIAYNTACGNEGAGNIPNNAFGYGRIDVLAAINSCLGAPQPTPTTVPTATLTPVPSPTPTAAPGLVMHVGDLDNESTKNRLRWNAVVRIKVLDANGNVVSGASVSGSWSAGATGTSSCTTASDGTCTVSKSNLKQSVTSVTFTVTNVTKSGATYDSSANMDPDGDSNGTVIVVNRP
jgi:subtilisin family serine protease